MLSTENPQPDLSRTFENSQLKSSCVDIRSSDEEKGSDSKNCQLDEVDLLDQSSVLDDKNPLPNFSIRDYAFSKRRKDIKTNWPFSQKALQLCLKHDLKDVLPPFQSLDSIKNPSLDKSFDENTSKSSLDYNIDPNLAVDTEKIDSNRSEKHKEFPSATYLETEAEISQRKKSEFAVQVESENPKPVKKCQLIVKLNNISEPKSNEELSLNNCGVSETMASKLCPVCKTFSSSSNTTLNAHIDRCLSGESTVKWTENSKSIKHRIKPRKTRLMVDIYSTALSCNLEDLDRRNGTNWASNLVLTGQDLEVCVEEKKNKMSSGNIGNGNEESAVYIDSNGTKVRILSKFNDLPSSSTVKDDNGAKKDKTSKILCVKKKKYLIDKDTVSKCPPEINNGKQREVSIEENLTQPHRTCDQIRSDDLGMIKQWVSSKRTGVRKKMNFEHKKQDKTLRNSVSKSNAVSLDKVIKRTDEINSSILCEENPWLRKRKDNLLCNSHDELSSSRKMVGFSLLTQNLQGKQNHLVKKLRKDGPSVCERGENPQNETENHDKTLRNSVSKSNTVSLDKVIKRTDEINSSILCDENPWLRKRKDNLPCNSHDELSSSRKMVGFSLLTQNLQGKQNHLVKKLRKDGPSVCERGENPQNETENHVSSRNFKKISQKFSSDGPCVSLRMPHEPLFSSRGEEFAFMKKSSLAGRKFSSLKKNLLSVKSKKLGRKCLDFKKPKLRYAFKADEESRFARRDNLVETPSKDTAPTQNEIDESPITMSSVSKIRKRKMQFMSKRKEISDTSESDSYETGASLDAIKDVELVCQPTPRITDEEAFTAFTKSLDSSFPASINPLDAECVSRHFTKRHEENVQPELNLRCKQEKISIEKVGKYMVSQNTDFVAEIDDNGGNGNYIVDVEPIPIPGPPGSFLPSPGRMGSEELPGSSSLTTCKIQSSEDEHELVVDMHSSDSSQTYSSLVSSFVPARSGSVLFTKSSGKSNFVRNENQRDVSENRINAEGVIKLDESRTKFMLNETASFRSKDGEPCCCSRKEEVLQSGPLNYQDSQLLRQHTLPVPVHENNVAYSSMGFVPERVSFKSEANFQACEPPSPLSPNPVLRLMGKNLMVVNKDENLQSNVENGGNMHNNTHHSFHHALSQGSQLFETVQRRIPAQHFDFNSSHGFKVPTVSRMVQLSPHPSTVMFSSKSSSVDCNMMPDQMRFNMPGDFSGRKHNDVIVLNDSAENESCLVNKSAFCDVNMEPGGSSAQMAWGYDSRHVNPNYNYPTMGYPLCSGSRIPNANSLVLHNGKNANLAEWIYAPENPIPLTASSPSTGVKPMTGQVSSVGYIHSLFAMRREL